MNAHTRTVRVFLSSTFRDFAEERDLLVRKVFPELRRKCRERQVELVDVDLRWGITTKEAQQGKVLPICLAEIDRSRPFFMGFLGERYGWMPKSTDYDFSLIQEQPWIDKHRGSKSVTELEILYGVLNNSRMAGRAFFYFRDPKWSLSRGSIYRSESPEHESRLATLKECIRRSGFPVVENYRNPEELALRVRNDLWALIEEAYPESEVPDSLMLERRRHEAYGAVRLRMYLGGDGYFRALDAALGERRFRPVMVTGASGGGKSALLANWVARLEPKHRKSIVLVHHLGCGADAADPVKLTSRMEQELARVIGVNFKPESDPEKTLEQWPHWLTLASAWAVRERRDVVLVFDGLDKVSDRRHLRWFPSFLPPRVKIFASCLEGEVLEAARGRLEWLEIAVKPLTKGEQRQFIRDYLARFRKSLAPKHIRKVQDHVLSTNPLFLLTLLEELRVFGVHDELDKRLETLLSPPHSKIKGEAPTVDDVFEHVLSRVEEDTGKKTIQAAMEALWVSRSGLFEEELLSVAGIAPARWAVVRNALDESFYENAGRICFAHDYLRKAVEDRYGLKKRRQKLLHRRLAEYFATLPMAGRVAEELPWQLEQAAENDKLMRCLVDKDMFVTLCQRDEFELLGYWVRLGADIDAAYEEAWKSWRIAGRERVEIAHRLAEFLLTAGCYSKFATKLLRLTLKHHESKMGPRHPDTLNCINNLGNLLHKQGNDDGAEILFRQALAGTEAAFGREHPETLELLNNLGVILKGKGDYHEGAEMYRRALAGSEKLLGDGHQSTLDCINNLGNLLYRQGNLSEAKSMYQRALAGYEKAMGAEHPSTLMALNNLAGLILGEGDFVTAENLYLKSLKGYEKSLGPEHPFTLSCIYNLGVLLGEKGDSSGSEAMHRRALAGREKSLGTRHPDTLMSLAALEALQGTKCASEGVERLMQAVLSGQAIPEQKQGAKVALKSVTEVLQSLNDGERRVLAMRFGLDDGKAQTPEEIGKALKVNQSRIRMIEAKAIRKLKHPKSLRILQSQF